MELSRPSRSDSRRSRDGPRRATGARPRASSRARLRSLPPEDLETDELVVDVDHGIGDRPAVDGEMTLVQSCERLAEPERQPRGLLCALDGGLDLDDRVV